MVEKTANSPVPPLRWYNLRRSEALVIGVCGMVLLASLLLARLNEPEALRPTQGSPKNQRARLPVNRASPAKLIVIPGVGEATAAAMVAERTKNGPFTSLDDLVRRVPRLTRKTLGEFAPFLDFSE